MLKDHKLELREEAESETTLARSAWRELRSVPNEFNRLLEP